MSANLLDALAPVITHDAAMTPVCEWIARAGRSPAVGTQPGDRVTLCTADRVYDVIDTDADGTRTLKPAGITPGDRSMRGQLLRVRTSHVEPA